METNDSGLPRVVRGAANRLQTDYISLGLSLSLTLLLSLSHSCGYFLPFSNSFDVMETLQKDTYLAEPLAVHLTQLTQMSVFRKKGQTQTGRYTDSECTPKPAAPLPELEWLLTHNFDPGKRKIYPFQPLK